MSNAHGSAKQVRYKKEVTWNVAPSAGGAQLLRRKTFVPNIKRSAADNDEIASHRQRTGVRLGVKTGDIAYAGSLSAGTFKDFLAAGVRRAFAAVSAISSLSVTIAAAGSAYTVTRAAGSWLTDGIKAGQVGRLTAGAFSAANLNNNLAVLQVNSATVLTVIPVNGAALVAEGPIASSTWTPTGKVNFIPSTGFTDDSFAFEDWQSDITPNQSELYTGAKLSEFGFSMSEDGNVDFSMKFIGAGLTTATAQYFTSPTNETSTPVCHSSCGTIALVAGTGELVIVTGLSMSLKGNPAGEPVVGSTTYSSIDQGRILVDGSLTAYFPDATLRDYFLNETEVGLIAIMAGSNAAAADFVGFSCPLLKFTGADKDDGDKPQLRTYPFLAEYNAAGGAGVGTEQTSMQIQDSQA